MTASRPSISLVLLTYEWPEALDVVFASLSEQSDQSFEVVVADDGSGPDTAAVVERWRATFGERLAHAWQTDDGWRSSRILNLAALHSQGEFLVFLDADCIPRRRFVEAVRRAALPGWFLASKRLNMSPALSQRVIEQHLSVWRWSAMRWFVQAPREVLTAPREVGRPGLLLPVRDRRRPWRQGQPEFTPPFRGYGFFFGIARSNFVRVNGWDNRFTGWGGEDVDLSIRLRRAGLKCGWPGGSATLLHLWHPTKRGTTPSNTPLRDETESSRRIEAVNGLRELSAELETEPIS